MLGIRTNSVDNMAKGTSRIPPGMWREIATMLQDREEELPILKTTVLLLADLEIDPAEGMQIAAERLKSKSLWFTGWPHDAEPSVKVEVEYRDGTRETAEVCEIDWNKSDDNDRYSPPPGREVVRYRFIPAETTKPPTP